MAQTIAIPNLAFAPAGLIKSSDMNNNFNTIQNFINGGNMGATNLAAGAIGASGNADLNSNIVDNSTLQLASNQISVKSGGIGTTQLATGAVNQDKLAARSGTFGSSCGVFSGAADTSEHDITNLFASITTKGRPVLVSLVPDGSANQSYYATTGNTSTTTIRLYRGASVIATWFQQGATGLTGSRSVSDLMYFDNAVAGTYTYKFTYQQSSASVFGILYASLVVYEL